MTLQDEIDAIEYPPTHTYILDGLIPTGSLLARVLLIEKEFPEFFKEGVLLDVGCNKGFFSLYHRGLVVGIDPDEKCVELCKKLLPSGNFLQTTFGGLHTDAKWDKIFIGNGHHYPFIEADGWSWIGKLAEMSCGQVLLEGPINMEGEDAKNCIPEHLVEEFALDRLLGAFFPYFYFIRMVQSPLVHRWFLLFEKRE